MQNAHHNGGLMGLVRGDLSGEFLNPLGQFGRRDQARDFLLHRVGDGVRRPRRFHEILANSKTKPDILIINNESDFGEGQC